MIYDVIIVGGGAAGLCAAVRIKQLNSKLNVLVAERLSRVGKKLITTGNGRCNITNKYITPDRYHGEKKEFSSFALNNFDTDFTESFFEEIGVLFTYEYDGKAYPYSLQASSVVDALRFAAERYGVEIITDCFVKDYKKTNEKFTLITSIGEFTSKNIILAGGLLSGGEKLGCDGSLLKLMISKGYKAVNTTPSIVQLKTPTDVVRSLKGIKVNAKVRLECDGKTVRTEEGEVLFCDYGLSGPPVMQISRDTARGKGRYTVNLDIVPEYTFSQLIEILNRRKKVLKNIPLEDFFTGMLNKRVGQSVLKQCGYKLSEKTENLTSDGIKRTVSLIKNMRFEVIGNTGFINSQVTAGGLSTDNFDSKTMMSRNDRGIYAIGEILDVDGDCGGFNLQWAWSSAFCAAKAISGGFL